MDELKKGSVPLEEFFSYFTDEEAAELVAFLCSAIKSENDAKPDRKDNKSISLRISPYNQMRSYWTRYKNKTIAGIKPLTTVNSQFNAKLYDLIGDKKAKTLADDLQKKRLHFNFKSYCKLNRMNHIIEDLRKGTHDYRITKKYDISSDNLRQLRHRLKKAGKL